MSIQDDVRDARTKSGVSRRVLAERSGLTESVIWRIETKGKASDHEAACLQRVLDGIIGRHPVDGDGAHPTGSTGLLPTSGAGTSGVRGSTPSGAGRLADPPTATEADAVDTAVDSPAQPGPAAPTVVDWGGLAGAAAGVSEHDLERGLKVGPQRAEGVRLFSNSEIQTFKDCRRKWWLAWYRQLKPRFESPTGALAIGDRIHRALRLYYVPTGLTRVDPRTALERLIAEDWTVLANALADEPEKLLSIQKKFNDEATLERAMIEGYTQWLGETGADSELDVISSEQYLEVDLTKDVKPYFADSTHETYRIIGKLDVRVKRRRDGVRLFIDHKSLAEFNTVRQTVPLDEQMLHYFLLEWLSTVDGEERCDGALYNMLRKVKRTGAAKPPFYDRIEVHHNQRELESYKRRLLATIGDILEVESLLNAGTEHLDVAYPRPTRDCRWKCQFFSVCPMFDDGSRAEDMLKQWFVKSDPLAYYQTGMSEGDAIE